MTERLNPEGLRYAQAVAETRSFSAAARACGVTQPALSTGIAKLEERLGGRLFDRSPRGVSQTGFGARILPLIERAVVALDAVTAEARRLTEPGEDKIRMGVSPLIDSHLVARAFGAVRELPVPRDLVLREANMRDLRDALRAGELDVILIPAVAGMSRFEHRIIAVEPVVVVNPQAGPETAGHRVLEERARLGLGSAMLPASKLTSPDVPHRPLMDQGRQVEISFEAVWSAGSPLGADLASLAETLADGR